MDSTAVLGLIDTAWCNRAIHVALECGMWYLVYTRGTARMLKSMSFQVIFRNYPYMETVLPRKTK